MGGGREEVFGRSAERDLQLVLSLGSPLVCGITSANEGCWH